MSGITEMPEKHISSTAPSFPGDIAGLGHETAVAVKLATRSRRRLCPSMVALWTSIPAVITTSSAAPAAARSWPPTR